MNTSKNRRGTVYLVGAGPGDPGLLTVAAARLLRRADVIIHDDLIDRAVLDLARPDAERFDVGKRCGGRRTTQEEINRLLIEWTARARTVVRLKGGDPFVFGRGAEEALALQEAGVRFRVVPGVTAGVGVSAYAGIPVTHRDFASTVTFVTGHENVRRSQPRIDWEALARVDGTLVVYMGVGTLGAVAEKLVRAGKAADTPAAVVEWGSYARQRTVTAPLSEISRAAERAGVGSPALVVIGEVVALRGRLAWFDRLPLRGKRVVVARTRPQPSRIARSLRRLGAEVIEYPKLRAQRVHDSAEVSEAIGSLTRYRWILFSSPAGVEHFWEKMKSLGLDSRAIAGVLIGSFGVATSRALERRGIAPDIATRTFNASAIVAALEGVEPLNDRRLLWARDSGRPSPIAATIRAAGADVDEIAVFDTVEEHETSTASLLDADLIVLPSSSAARMVGQALGGRPTRARVVAIGPATAQTALDRGLRIDSVAADHSARGVVDAGGELLRADPDAADSAWLEVLSAALTA